MSCVFNKLSWSIQVDGVMVNNHSPSCHQLLNKFKLLDYMLEAMISIHKDKVKMILRQVIQLLK